MPKATKKPLRIEVDVTADVIEKATKRSSSHCVAADAIKASYPHLKFVAVDIQTIRYTDPDTQLRHICFTPRSVQDMLINFDRGINPVPFSFRIRPTQVIKAGRLPPAPPDANGKATPRKPRVKLARSNSLNVVPRKQEIGIKVGGQSPPQMSTRREFGVRAYR